MLLTFLLVNRQDLYLLIMNSEEGSQIMKIIMTKATTPLEHLLYGQGP